MALREIGAILSGCVNEAVVFACEAYVFNILKFGPQNVRMYFTVGAYTSLGSS